MNNGKRLNVHMRTESASDNYQALLDAVTAGAEQDAMHVGSIASRREFASKFFEASVMGKQIAEQTGKQMVVPDLEIDEHGRSKIVMTEYQPQAEHHASGPRKRRGEEAAARFGIEDDTEESVDLSLR